MIKRLVVFIVAIILLFVALYFVSNKVADKSSVINFLSVDIYFALATIVIVVLLYLANIYSPGNVGYLFLSLVFVKLGLFLMIFNEIVFGDLEMIKSDKIILFVALTLSMILEGVFSVKLLSKQD